MYRIENMIDEQNSVERQMDRWPWWMIKQMDRRETVKRRVGRQIDKYLNAWTRSCTDEHREDKDKQMNISKLTKWTEKEKQILLSLTEIAEEGWKAGEQRRRTVGKRTPAHELCSTDNRGRWKRETSQGCVTIKYSQKMLENRCCCLSTSSEHTESAHTGDLNSCFLWPGVRRSNQRAS